MSDANPWEVKLRLWQEAAAQEELERQFDAYDWRCLDPDDADDRVQVVRDAFAALKREMDAADKFAELALRADWYHHTIDYPLEDIGRRIVVALDRQAASRPDEIGDAYTRETGQSDERR